MTFKVTNTSIKVIKGQNTMNFTCRDISTCHLVRTMFEKIMIFPIIMSYLLEEYIFFFFGVVRRNLLVAR